MELWLWVAFIGIFLYSFLSAFEVFRCPILSQETKLHLMLLCIIIPIIDPYLSKRAWF